MNNEILIESQTARNEEIQKISNQDCIVKLNHVKKIDFNNFDEDQVITTNDVAEFYEIFSGTLIKLIQRNRDELESDGLKTLTGSQLQKAKDIMSSRSSASQITIWTPRAVLRAGMLLRDSEIAKSVRTALLDKVEQKPQSAIDVLEQVFYSFKAQQEQLHNHEQRIDWTETTLQETMGEVDTLKERIENNRNNANNLKISLRNFCDTKGFVLDKTLRGIGRTLTKFCRVAIIDYRETGLGVANEYPYWLLEILFETAEDFDANIQDMLKSYIEYYSPNR